MAGRKITQAFSCEVCGRRTSRLIGVGAGVVTHDAGAVSLRSAVLGYCAAHRADVLPVFTARLAEDADVEWVSDPPIDLRPADVDDFFATIDAMMADQGSPTGPTGTTTGSPSPAPRAPSDPIAPPRDCPHCGGAVSWGTGPHVADAAMRTGARAWACPACGAAGLFTTLR